MADTLRTNVYIDGFNFYYGAVRGTKYKWLNLAKMCQLLLPNNTLHQIKYYTARVSARVDDPDQPARQEIFFRALRTIPNLTIVYGHFLTNTVTMPLAISTPGKMQYASVIKTEEKGSDVNLATHLLNDGYKGDYEIAVVVTNDSDLVEPIRIVRQELNLPVGILNPHKTPSHVLQRDASFVKPIRAGVLAASQFPDTLNDSVGTFHKPPKW